MSTPSKGVNPDEMVAIGAAVQGAVLTDICRRRCTFAGVIITLIDERASQAETETFHAKGGLKEMVQFLNANKKPLHPEFCIWTPSGTTSAATPIQRTRRRHGCDNQSTEPLPA